MLMIIKIRNKLNSTLTKSDGKRQIMRVIVSEFHNRLNGKLFKTV